MFVPNIGLKITWAIKKDFFHLIMSAGQRSPHEESNLRPLDFALWCSTTERQRLYGERGPLWSSHLKCILHTARISNVDSVMFVNRIREMASFELGKEIKEDVFRLVMSVGQGMGDILCYHGFTNQKNIIWNMKLKWEIISTVILVM